MGFSKEKLSFRNTYQNIYKWNDQMSEICVKTNVGTREHLWE